MKYIIFILALNLQARELNQKYLVSEYPKYEKTIKTESKKNGIDYVLIVALICFENHKWNAKAKSKTGDLGLMQIHTKDTSYLNPTKNLKYGIKKLSDLIKRFGLVKGLTAYNRGVAGMKRTKTSKYTKGVLKFYKQLGGLK